MSQACVWQPTPPWQKRSASTSRSRSHPALHRVSSICVLGSKVTSIPALTSDPNTATWDPEGLLSRTPLSGGHFDRRDRQRQGESAVDPPRQDAAYPGPGINKAAATQSSNRTSAIAAEHALRGGLSTAERDLYDHSGMASNLAADYLPVNLEHAGLRIQHLEPPVFTVDAFLTAAECQQFAEQTEQTGLLQQSKIGEGGVDSAAVAINARRTSSTLLLSPEVVRQHPALSPAVLALQSKAQQLLPLGGWSPPGQLPPPGHFCFESLQVARYQPGQHFLEHEDAFPPGFVQQNRFQRQATLLIYLNDVEDGGCTHFEQLNLSIQPKCGKALLFFPAFSDGTPDPRTSHTAQSPSSTKWVSQVWVTGGHPLPQGGQSTATGNANGSNQRSAAAAIPAVIDTSAGEEIESRLSTRRKKKGGKLKSRTAGGSKGFG